MLVLAGVARSADADAADAAGVREAVESLRAASLAGERLQAFLASNFVPQAAAALLVRTPPVSAALKAALVDTIGNLVLGCGIQNYKNVALWPGLRTAPVARAYLASGVGGAESGAELCRACRVVNGGATMDDHVWRDQMVPSGALARLLAALDGGGDAVPPGVACSALAALTSFVWGSAFSTCDFEVSLVPWGPLGRAALLMLQRRAAEGSLASDADADFRVACGALSLLNALYAGEGGEPAAAAAADAVRNRTLAAALFPLVLSSDASAAPPPATDRKGKGKRTLDDAAPRVDEETECTLAESAVVTLSSVVSCLREAEHPDATIAVMRATLLESGPVLDAITQMYAAAQQDSSSWAAAGLLLDCAYPERAPHRTYHRAAAFGGGAQGAAHDVASEQQAQAWQSALDNLQTMGFDQQQAKAALTQAYGNADRAAEILLGTM